MCPCQNYTRSVQDKLNSFFKNQEDKSLTPNKGDEWGELDSHNEVKKVKMLSKIEGFSVIHIVVPLVVFVIQAASF